MTQESPRVSRVLVVDDDAVILRAATVMLQRDGFQVLSIDDAEAGLAAAKDPSIDVLVLDINMPHLSGLEVLRAIKAERPEVEVIMMTAYPTVETAVEAVKLGAFDFLIKPFENIDDLSLKVGKAAERKALLDHKRGLVASRSGSPPSLDPNVVESGLPSRSRTDIKALVVDDDTVVLKAATALLKRAGFSVLSLDDAEAGLAAAKDPSTDVVVLDINMPHLSGLDLLKAIKAERPEVEVIMMTAYPTVETAVEAIKAGAFDFLVKPFEDIDELGIAVAKAAARKAPPEASRAG